MLLVDSLSLFLRGNLRVCVRWLLKEDEEVILQRSSLEPIRHQVA